MFGWLNRRRELRAQREVAELLRRLDRAELHAAINTLDHRRNHVEALMQRMLEERRA